MYENVTRISFQILPKDEWVPRSNQFALVVKALKQNTNSSADDAVDGNGSDVCEVSPVDVFPGDRGYEHPTNSANLPLLDGTTVVEKLPEC